MLIAQITDMHVVAEGELAMGSVDTNTALAAAVDRLNGFSPQPDIVVITGDLTDGGKPQEYRRLRQLLAPMKAPFAVLPGNHDDRPAMREAFADHAYLPQSGSFLHWVIEDYPLRIVALDSVDPGSSGGRLCAERLAWLDVALARAADRPTLLALHHPPFDTGIDFMDRIGLEDRDGLAEVVSRHRQVERVICGHVHRPVQVRFAGTLASISPSTAHQIPLTLDPDQPDAWLREPAGLCLFLWTGRRLVGHTLYIGDHGNVTLY